MSRHNSVTVRVPASTANLGPGFDCLGLALEVYNTVELSLAVETTVQVTGEGQGYLPLGRSNLVLQAADRIAEQAGQQVPGWHLRQHNEIPLARGLGSSSTAIVGGLIAANELLQAGLDRQQLLQIATEIEGHPDNVGPALYGGLTACCVELEDVCCIKLDAPTQLDIGVVIPRFKIDTRQAREVLPEQVPFEDAVFNVSRAACTLAALVAGRWEKLSAVMKDRLHQPARAPLIPGMEEVISAAEEAGAHGAALSGSGPTIVAFATEQQDTILDAMVRAFANFNVEATGFWTKPNNCGALVVQEMESL